jgi:hypothetical protein
MPRILHRSRSALPLIKNGNHPNNEVEDGTHGKKKGPQAANQLESLRVLLAKIRISLSIKFVNVGTSIRRAVLLCLKP